MSRSMALSKLSAVNESLDLDHGQMRPRQVQIAGAMARLLSSPREVIHSRRQDIRATSQKPNTGGRDDHENTKR